MQLPNQNKKKKPSLLTPTGTSAATMKKPETATRAGTRAGNTGTSSGGTIRNPSTGGNLPTRKPATPAGKTTFPNGSGTSGSRVNYAGGIRSLYPDPTNPLLTKRGSENQYGEAPRVKSITEIYLENRNNPLVDELMAEEEARIAAEETRKTPANMEAVGKAMYERVMGKPDRATLAGRQAEENAYDLARRSAGGAGTSYAAMAGAKAYQDAYADERDRMEDEEQYEQDRMADAYLTAMELYDGTNGDGLRGWLTTEGFSAEEARALMKAVSGDWSKKQAEQDAKEADALAKADAEEYKNQKIDALAYMIQNADTLDADTARSYASYIGIHDEDLDELIKLAGLPSEQDTAAKREKEIDAVLESVDANGNLIYNGQNRNTAAEILKRMGYSQSEIDGALERMDALFTSEVNDAGVIMAEAIRSGRLNSVFETYDLGISEKEWSAMSEGEKIFSVLDTMSDMVLHDGMDNAVFVDLLAASVEESARAAVDSLNKKTIKTDAAYRSAFEQLSSYIQTAEEFLEDGSITDDQFEQILQRLSSAVGKTGVDSRGNLYWQGKKIAEGGYTDAKLSAHISAKKRDQIQERMEKLFAAHVMTPSLKKAVSDVGAALAAPYGLLKDRG